MCFCIMNFEKSQFNIHYVAKSTGTPSLEEKKALPNCANKDINLLKNCISTLCCTSFEVYERIVPICTSHLVFGDECLYYTDIRYLK